jgi:hypothetical protein
VEAVNRSLIVYILALSQSAFAAEIQFDDLRTNFKQYDGQQVTVKGILEVAGNDNYLYRDIEGRERQRVWIHVLPDLNRPSSAGGFAPDAPANLHWVKVTGVVDTRTTFESRVAKSHQFLVLKHEIGNSLQRRREIKRCAK